MRMNKTRVCLRCGDEAPYPLDYCDECEAFLRHWEWYRWYSERCFDMHIDFVMWCQKNYPLMKPVDFWNTKHVLSFLWYFVQETYSDYWEYTDYYADRLEDLLNVAGYEAYIGVRYGMSETDDQQSILWRARGEIRQHRFNNLFRHKSDDSWYSRPQCEVFLKLKEKHNNMSGRLTYKLNEVKSEISRRELAIKRRVKASKLNKFYKDGYSRVEIVNAIPGSHTSDEWLAILEYYNHSCVACGSNDSLSKDHVIPVTWKGTSDSYRNLQPLCRSCNSKKGNRNAIDYRPYELPNTSQELLEWFKLKQTA